MTKYWHVLNKKVRKSVGVQGARNADRPKHRPLRA
jgi:hypothetical protein